MSQTCSPVKCRGAVAPLADDCAISSFQNKQSKERGQEQDATPGDAVFKRLAIGQGIMQEARCRRCKAAAPMVALNRSGYTKGGLNPVARIKYGFNSV